MEFLGRRKVAVASIATTTRLRPVEPAWAAALAEMIGRDGLQTPPTLRQLGADGEADLLETVAGSHRIAAIQLLGWTEVEADIIRCDDDTAALMEIDENLARRSLSVLEEAVFLAERKQVYERLHPETRHGGDRKSDHIANLATRSARFTTATEEALGKSERTIQRRVSLGETLRLHLPAELLQGLLASPHADDASGLEMLAKAPPNERAKLVRAVLRDKSPALSLAAAIRPSVTKPPVDEDDEQFNALVNAWRKNTRAKARQQFREWLTTAEAARAGLN